MALLTSLRSQVMLASRRIPKAMRVAVVVPALNEEAALRQTLPRALAGADELVGSGGGSADETVEVARRLGARVVTGPAGRGGQLNRGAAATSAEILLFLHADTTLPSGAIEAVRQSIAGAALGGAFLGPILEDLDFAWRLRRRGRLAILGLHVTTGARRFLELGVLRTVATNWLIWLLFVLGVSPRRLARLYGQIR